MNRILQELQDEGLIELKRGRVEITDLRGLKARSNGS